MLVESEPTGASIWANDVPLGRAPLLLHGEPDSELRLQARWGDQPAVRHEESFKLGAAGRLRIRAPRTAATPSSRPTHATPAAATSAPAASRPAGSRQITLSGKAARKTRMPERPVGWAALDVLVAPWARVRVDGEERGQTPLKGLRLQAGTHLLEVSNPELGKSERRRLRLRPGDHAVIRRNWTR